MQTRWESSQTSKGSRWGIIPSKTTLQGQKCGGAEVWWGRVRRCSPLRGCSTMQVFRSTTTLPAHRQGGALRLLTPWSRVRKRGQARKLLMGQHILLALLFYYVINACHCINLHKLKPVCTSNLPIIRDMKPGNHRWLQILLL